MYVLHGIKRMYMLTKTYEYLNIHICSIGFLISLINA